MNWQPLDLNRKSAQPLMVDSGQQACRTLFEEQNAGSGRLVLPGIWLVALLLGCGTRAESAEPAVATNTATRQSGDWSATAVLAAPEAVQAAAADKNYVYAIANTQVARYDRRTGRREAVSSGQAKHLNSGFLWEGKLYCAHSNYPQQPEQSEIKVLDLQSMQLSTYRDFGNYGGSLTWAVRLDDHWWCNFARYGDDNRHTFLVKFDSQWRELGRWTYPAKVIAKLGRYSLSGGIWQRGELLVTGHDDPVVFRLRLPRSGQELEFLGTQSVPFTGQGIASDAHGGGLVGIDRAKRQVVFARQQ